MIVEEGNTGYGNIEVYIMYVVEGKAGVGLSKLRISRKTHRKTNYFIS